MKKTIILLLALLILCMGVFVSCQKKDASEQMQTKYVLYIGFPEKTDDALDATVDVINGICIKHVSGYTMYEGEGGWTNDNGTFVKEETLIYCFNFTDESSVQAIADEVLATVSGSNILFEKQLSYAVHSSSPDFPKA